MSSNTFNKFLLSGSANGRQIPVTGTVTVHTATSSGSELDEVYLYAINNGISTSPLKVQWGGTNSSDICQISLPAQIGRLQIVDGKLIGGALPIAAWILDNGTVAIDGFVNRIGNLTSTAIDPRITDWVARVVRNGGGIPSLSTQKALSTFVQAVSSANIMAKMVSIVVHVPDDLIAATTPIVPGPGLDPWTNNNFVSGDLTINGLKGNGSNKSLNTGVIAASSIMTSNSAGLTAYTYDPTSGGNSGYALGSGGAANSSQFAVYAYSGGTDAIGYCWRFVNTNTNDGASATSLGPGYLSVNRTNASQLNLYCASSTIPHASIAQATGAQTGSIEPTYSVYAHAVNAVGSIAGQCDRRISFLALHQGLTSNESLNFFNAIQALRVAIGGGFV